MGKKLMTAKGKRIQDKKLSVIVKVLEIENILTETTNSITGEIEYILSLGESQVYILASDLHIMLAENDNINDLYDSLTFVGFETMLMGLDTLQAKSAQIKVVEKFNCIEAYTNDITIFRANITINENDNIVKYLIDTLLTSM